MTNEAILSSNGNYTLFSFNGYVIRFRTSSKLERYTKILEWENGYIAVTAKYKGLPEEEEYIDLVPILENLYIDPDEFLKQIEKVSINGYAFTKSGDYIRVLNLNRPNKALVFDYNQEVIETSMDDIEIQIVFDYYNKNKKYMEV